MKTKVCWKCKGTGKHAWEGVLPDGQLVQCWECKGLKYLVVKPKKIPAWVFKK